MLIADMHSDSLLHVSSEVGLVKKYNAPSDSSWLQVFAAFVPFRGRSAEERRRELLRLMNIYVYETDRLGISRIDTVRGLCGALDMNERASIFSVEGGGGLLADSEELFTMHKLGLRIFGFAWDSNELASGALAENDEGLSAEGRRMAKRLAELGIVADVSHISDRAFWHLCDTYPLLIIATHSNFRAVTPSRRNLTPEMAREISARGGVIGLNLYPEFLREGGNATVDDIYRHVDYALTELGESVLGYGFDIDGTDGKYPLGITESASIYDTVTDYLLSKYPSSVVSRIAGENVADFMKGVL
jgi:membrane dipeptidase